MTGIFEPMPAVIERPEIREREDEKVDRPWMVVVYDDPVNLMAYVTMVFETVLQMTHGEAERKMWEVHIKGRSVVWEGGRERAEVFVQQIQLHGLQVRLERSE